MLAVGCGWNMSYLTCHFPLPIPRTLYSLLPTCLTRAKGINWSLSWCIGCRMMETLTGEREAMRAELFSPLLGS